jgi:hypothetical protein
MFFRNSLSFGWGTGAKSTYCISTRLRKNYCPNCNELLKIERRRKVVRSNSKEAANWDFSFGSHGRLIGTCKFHFDVLCCEKCSLEIYPADLTRLKREQRKLEKMKKKGKFL